MMKHILCFGDSNTFGANPLGGRHPWPARWTGVMQRELGGEYRVIEEGLNGRTTVYDDPMEPGRRGVSALPACLEAHKPLDLVIVMLGTNDTKHRFGATAADLASGLGCVVSAVERFPFEEYGTPQILVVSPPAIREGISGTAYGSFTEEAAALSRRFAQLYRGVADAHGCAFFDAACVARASEADRLHLDAENHAALGKALAARVRALLGS